MFVRKANSIIRDLKNILALLNLEEGVDQGELGEILKGGGQAN